MFRSSETNLSALDILEPFRTNIGKGWTNYVKCYENQRRILAASENLRLSDSDSVPASPDGRTRGTKINKAAPSKNSGTNPSWNLDWKEK
jgi:hypothetical protein